MECANIAQVAAFAFQHVINARNRYVMGREGHSALAQAALR